MLRCQCPTKTSLFTVTYTTVTPESVTRFSLANKSVCLSCPALSHWPYAWCPFTFVSSFCHSSLSLAIQYIHVLFGIAIRRHTSQGEKHSLLASSPCPFLQVFQYGRQTASAATMLAVGELLLWLDSASTCTTSLWLGSDGCSREEEPVEALVQGGRMRGGERDDDESPPPPPP